MARRVRYHLNRHVQWFHPPLRGGPRPEEATMTADDEGRIAGLDPDTWAMELGFALDRLWPTYVGRAVIGCIRRRTTLYSTIGGAQTTPDPYDDQPTEYSLEREAEVRRMAMNEGAPAMLWIDLHRPGRQSGGADVSTPQATLFHELVHAMNITWGNYRLHLEYEDGLTRRRYGAPSVEEEFAWVIENMFRSETGMWLRRQYDPSNPLPPGIIPRSSNTGTNLGDAESRVVARCNRKIRPLAAALEHLEPRVCPYNPFREWASLSPVQRGG